MWSPIRISFINLFAHKESTYEFTNNTCTVIVGKNETNRGLKNNGAGKTTLFEAISIALTGESLRALKKESFINIEEESCEVRFELFNSVLNKKLEIVRKFFRGGKSSKIELFENDIINNQITSVAEANKRVYELIGISREDLLRYFIISQDSRYTFFTASDSDKKEIMNRITSADMVNPIIEELNIRYKEKELEYKDINDDIDKLSEKKILIDEQRQEVANSNDIEEDIDRLNDKIFNLSNNYENIKQNDITDINKKIKELSEFLDNSEDISIKIIGQQNKAKKLSNKGEELENDIKENKKLIQTFELELESTAKCPKCGHEFIRKSELNLSVKETKKFLLEAKLELKKNKLDQENNNEEQKKVNRIKKELEQEKEDIEDRLYEKERYEKRLKQKEDEASDILNDIDKIKKEIKSLKERKADNKVLNNLNKKFNDCDKEISELSEKIIPITEELERIKFWQFNMGRSGFQTYLANKAIKILEGSTNYFLEKMKIDYRIMISPFTILKSGEVREKIDCFVSDNGINSMNFLSYSGGERQRVTLAGILAVQKLINLSLDGKGINMLLLDESLGNIDSTGTMEIVKILENLGITVMLITQNIEDSSIFRNSLQVVKKEGISSFTK